MWRCPLCTSPLDLTAHPIKCDNNHHFDKAKSGYVNLLPVQFKKSKQPGDDKAMVRARREFHDNRSYAPLMDTMSSLLAAHFCKNEQKEIQLYDAGCGEGAYIEHCSSVLAQSGFTIASAGSDISKIAVELAAKRYKHMSFAVASSFDLPLQDCTQDAIIQVFAPGSTQEYGRVLRPKGVLLTVDPAPEHLFELKSLVYDNPRQHKINDEARAGMTKLAEERCRFTLRFENEEQALALVKMTPFYWRLPKDSIDSICKALKQVTADFHIQLWQNGTYDA